MTTTNAPADALVERPSLRRARLRESLAGYGFMAPWLAGFFALTVGPMIASLYLSFTDYDLFAPPEFIGADNYARLLSDPQFLQSIKVTVIYVVLGTPIKLAAALGVAMLLNAKRRGLGFYRSAFYAPSLVAASVSIAIVWKAMFIDDGVVDSSLRIFGVELGGWVGNPDMTMPMFILLAVWAFGGPMVIFLAGLKQVPGELYEAAEMDGAGRLRQFRNITLPMLSPVIFFNLLMETIGSFQVFGSAFIISGGTGGPAGSTLFYTLYLYQRGFRDFAMGYASAMAWLLVIAVGLITILLFRTSKAWVHYQGDAK
ncbi:carbohydrate ABC transporter permease [Ruania halotolerans]|uniref:carbohydrate ABC transporter permease n=1 Tax=Ruania halotolerans TaxID=2897773 RepID=UPI003F495433